MSKLVEKLHQTSRVSIQPLGFKGAASTSTQKGSPMVLIAVLPEGDASAAAGGNGSADAWLVKEADSQVLAALGQIPWGASLEKGTEKELTHFKEMGCDFLVFNPATAPLALLGDDELGKIVEVDASLSDGMIRAIDKLSVDAVLIGGDSELSVHRLMVCQHVANLVRKPLLALAPLDTPKEALEDFQEAGIVGVVVKLGGGGKKGLSQLRQAIDSLPPTRRRRKERMEALLPYLGQGTQVEEEEDFE